MKLIKTLLVLLCLSGPAFAVQPDEVLDDPALEARARELSKDLRCLVCRNESIDDSNASLARDLRVLLRERLVAGDSDEEVMDFMVDRYGEYVLLNPTTNGVNILLWGAGPAFLLLGAGVAFVFVRKHRSADPKAKPGALSDAEQERLKALLGDAPSRQG